MSIRAAQLTFLDAAMAKRCRRNGRLDAISAALDWSSFERLLAPLRRSGWGAPGYAPLTLFKTLVLQRLYDLSDPEMEQRLSDTLSWLSFVGLGLEDETPDHSTISRFRSNLIERGLLDALFSELQRQLDAKGLVLRQGTLIDASLVPSAAAPPSRASGEKRSRVDADAAWGSYGGRGVFGYKLHVAVDRGSLLIRRILVSAANRHDGEFGPDLVMGDEAAVFADKAYDNATLRAHLAERGIDNCIMRRPNKHHPLLAPGDQARNARLAHVRGRVETIFGLMKRVHRHTRLRYFSLRRNLGQMMLLAFAMNIKRAAALTA